VGGLTAEAIAGRRIIIGANGATSLLESLAHVLPAGIVVTSDPTYYIYTSVLERLGFELLPVPEDHDGLRIDALERKLHELDARASQISFFYLVTINNPSCAIISNSRRRQLVETVTRLSERLGRAVPLVLDRAYEDLVHDPGVGHLESCLLCDPAGLVYELGTLSKVLAPALRIGYMIGRDNRFMDAMVQRTFDSGFSASLITQEISSWLLDYQVEDQLTSVRAGYRAKAQAVRAWVHEYLGDALEDIVGGRAGFYLYLTFRSVETCEGSAFFRYLSRTTGDPVVDGEGEKKPRVVYIPGQICVHPRGELAETGRRQLRLSYAYETLENLHQAIRLMREAALYAGQLNQKTGTQAPEPYCTHARPSPQAPKGPGVEDAQLPEPRVSYGRGAKP
jgi:DNA-binding transcriptional MocR family regulator